MLYNRGDMAAFAASHPLAHTPGTVFSYSSGNSNILSRIIRQTVGEKDYAAYPFTALFYKIGMYHTCMEPDASGTYVGSSYINATARDYARFGLLYYNNGAVEWRTNITGRLGATNSYSTGSKQAKELWLPVLAEWCAGK